MILSLAQRVKRKRTYSDSLKQKVPSSTKLNTSPGPTDLEQLQGDLGGAKLFAFFCFFAGFSLVHEASALRAKGSGESLQNKPALSRHANNFGVEDSSEE